MSRPAPARPYNTQLIDPREYKSYWDLFNPKLKGKILSSDIRRVRGAGIPWQFLYYSPELGPKYLAPLLQRDGRDHERRPAPIGGLVGRG